MRKALLVGIDTYPDAPLSGCVNDTSNMYNAIDQGLFPATDVRRLTNDAATGAAIRGYLHDLVQDAQPGDSLLFYFSGHGTRVPTTNDGTDRVDEALCGVNFDESDRDTYVCSDDFATCVNSLPGGVYLTWILDACYSGIPAGQAPAHGDKQFPISMNASAANANPSQIKDAAIDHPEGVLITYLSACRADQVAKVIINSDGKPGGALTTALLFFLGEPGLLQAKAGGLLTGLKTLTLSYGVDQDPELWGDAAVANRPLFGGIAAPPVAPAPTPKIPAAPTAMQASGGTRACNAATIALIKKFEGLVDGDPTTTALDPYLDPVQIWTIGWGHALMAGGKFLRGATDKARAYAMFPGGISMDRAQTILESDLAQCSRDVQALLKVTVNDNQFGALVSFAFNLGVGALAGSTLLKLLNASNFAGAATQFHRWVHAGGNILQGLVDRRNAEAALFLTPSV